MIRHASQHTSVEAIRKRLIEVSTQDEANYSRFTCISRHGEGHVVTGHEISTLSALRTCGQGREPS